MGDIIKCTVCGGNLRMVTENEGVCNYCESVVRINQIPKKIKVDGISGVEDYLKRGEEWIQLEEWDAAVAVFDKVIHMEPKLAAGHIGKFLANTWNFRRNIISSYSDNYYESFSKIFELEDAWFIFKTRIITEEVKKTIFFNNAEKFFEDMRISVNNDMDYAIRNGYVLYEMPVEDVFPIDVAKNRIVVTGKIRGVLTPGRRCKFVDNYKRNVIARAAIIGIEKNNKLKFGISVDPKGEKSQVGICIKIYDSGIDLNSLKNSLLLDEGINIDRM